MKIGEKEIKFLTNVNNLLNFLIKKKKKKAYFSNPGEKKVFSPLKSKIQGPPRPTIQVHLRVEALGKE
jgi:hypothetical protein